VFRRTLAQIAGSFVDILPPLASRFSLVVIRVAAFFAGGCHLFSCLRGSPGGAHVFDLHPVARAGLAVPLLDDDLGQESTTGIVENSCMGSSSMDMSNLSRGRGL